MNNLPEYKGVIPSNLHSAESTIINLESLKGSPSIRAEIQMETNTFPLPSDNNGKAKHPLSLEQMIDHIGQRLTPLTTDDKQLLHHLLHIKSYFRIAYFSKLLFSNDSHNKPSLDDLVALVDFDSYLRSSITRLTPSIELYVKTTLMNLLLSLYPDSEVYLNHKIYKTGRRDMPKLEVTLARCATSLRNIQKTSIAVKHQVDAHGGHIPVWVLFESLTFGEFNMLCGRLDKRVLEEWAAIVKQDIQNYEPFLDLTIKAMPSFCQSVQYLRNTAAHNSRVLSKNLTSNPSVRSNNAYWNHFIVHDGPVNMDKEIHTVFMGLMVMRFFYACLGKSEINKWESFCNHLTARIYDTAYLNVRHHLGFPDNWAQLLHIAPTKGA